MAATRTIDSDIRPISDLRNKFAEIADYVQGGRPVIFTRNGYGCMVTMSYDAYKRLNDPSKGCHLRKSHPSMILWADTKCSGTSGLPSHDHG